MAKIVNEELEIKLVLRREEGEVSVDCSAHYEVSSEGVSQRRGCPIELTSAQETAIKNFAGQVIAQVREHEGVG